MNLRFTRQPAKSQFKLFLILLVAVLLRFYNLAGQSLWADEGNSVALARRGFVEIARRTAFDIHPPLYYWLLKVWVTLFGDGEAALRSLSAALGVGLVYLTWLVGGRLFGRRAGLVAAFVAALSPLQVYYAQEARMYMLLAFLGALAVLLALLILERPRSFWLKAGYVVTVTAGLYTHYAFPVMLVVVNLIAILCFARHSQLTRGNSQLLNWLWIQVVPLLLYLPWLPTAWRQVTTWPTEQQPDSLPVILDAISTTLLFGLSWPYDFGLWPVALLLISATVAALRKPGERLSLMLLWLWLLLPVLVTIFVFSPAFLKFLLVAAPALALLLGFAIDRLSRMTPKWLWYPSGAALLLAVASTSLLSLYHYYTDDRFARDDYRNIVSFIKAVGDAEDAVILHAEGQQDVFDYYYDRAPTLSAPVYPLPRHRPLDEADTLAELGQIAQEANSIYAVYWATHQADPDGLIENWLNENLFKATDRWFGNVRLASYSTPLEGDDVSFTPVNYQLGDKLGLTAFALSSRQVRPGDILEVTLQWEAEESPAENYVVFLQVLDENNHLVGQRDARPLMLTSNWPVKQPVEDFHGVLIEPGTPPGPHRLIVGMYNSETGERLSVEGENGAEGSNFIELSRLEVIEPSAPRPAGAFDIQHRMNVSMEGLSLFGYDFYKLGHRSAPETILRPGDPVQLTAYWRRDNKSGGFDNNVTIRILTVEGELTGVAVERPLAGVNLPVEAWQVGEITRAQYDFFLKGLSPGLYRLALELSRAENAEPIVIETEPFQIK